jgi:hypothetical protein
VGKSFASHLQKRLGKPAFSYLQSSNKAEVQMTDPNQRKTLSITELGAKYQVSAEAIEVLVRAIRSGGGRQAQFSHPDLGGMGQWGGGNMIMIGDMFNHSLKDRVAKLCQEISSQLDDFLEADEKQAANALGRETVFTNWWPSDLGVPSSAGAQNNMRYACFPHIHRLAIERDGHLTIYDTGSHRLSGFAQQQSSGQSLTFTSQHGPVRVEDLIRIEQS